MWSVIGIILISLNLVAGNGYYWKDYNETIPTDAIVDCDTGLAIVQVPSKKYDGIHPTGVKRTGAAAVKYEKELVTESTKVLCSESLDGYNWEWVTAATVKSRNQSNKLVIGGHDSYGPTYIAKIFVKDRWYLGEIEFDICYFYDVDGCPHEVTSNGWCKAPDCMVLTHK